MTGMDEIVAHGASWEIPLGHVIEWNGRGYRCVETDSGCDGCAFDNEGLDTDPCCYLRCDMSDRKDGADTKLRMV
jgi:hypothetical protein